MNSPEKLPCAVPNCPIRSENLFQSPASEANCRRWMKVLKITKNKFFICQEHFEEKFIEKKPRLWSTPTLWINNDIDESVDHCESCLMSLKDQKCPENAYKVDERFKEMFLDVTECEVS